jgi:hypothetical protein
MIDVTYYDKSTGVLGEAWFYPSEESKDLNVQGRDYVDGKWDSRTHYILNGEVTERPTQSTTLDGRTLTGLPIPATLHIDGETYEVDDGEAELDFILPGTYRLRVVAWPYRDWEEELVMA